MNRLSIFFLCLAVCVSCGQDASLSLKGARVVYDPAEPETVALVAGLLENDIRMVSGVSAGESGTAIIAGVVGSGGKIDSLAIAGVLDVSEISGDTERYIIDFIDGKTVVVAGSDRRGAAYGMFRISEMIGVDPFYWWADVPVMQDAEAAIPVRRVVSSRPSVKYRGIFINDEDWGMKPWSSNNYEAELGDIGPKTYAAVCELILRLGGNMLAPAMHSCTGAFYSHPESKVVADRYGIIITTSHCEPMLVNNAAKSEWDSHRDGEWNYRTNKQTIWNKFNDRIAEAGMYENIYTMAMRGVHDEGLRGHMSPEEKVGVLAEVIADQRDILTSHIDKPIEQIPQIFVPYKETLDIYNLGLEVPDDVTIVWPDDNYGYIKRISDPSEQERSGGSGVYYHVSYLGAPHDYLWLATTPPVLMYHELMKAYEAGADRYWLLNVGDIKPSELAMKTFFDLAMDVDAYDIHSINTHQAEYLAGIYGKHLQNDLQDILDGYYQLAWSRKPEFMGWEREWDRPELADISDTEYSFTNYSEAQRRLADYAALSEKAGRIMAELPKQYRPSFYEMVAFPVLASDQMNRKFLYAQLNHELYAQGRHAEANWAADMSRGAYETLDGMIDEYNSMLDGKWDGMMDLAPGWCARYQNMPRLDQTDGVEPVAANLQPVTDVPEGYAVIDLTKGGEEVIAGLGYDWHVVPVTELSYTLPQIDADSVTVHISTIPFWPAYEGKSNRIAVSLDGGEETVLENIFVEYGESWKDQVLRNGHEYSVNFALDGSKKHTLHLRGIDDGQLVQKIILDWGGLKPSYLGPIFYSR